jgi:hypothetical protein
MSIELNEGLNLNFSETCEKIYTEREKNKITDFAKMYSLESLNTEMNVNQKISSSFSASHYQDYFLSDENAKFLTENAEFLLEQLINLEIPSFTEHCGLSEDQFNHLSYLAHNITQNQHVIAKTLLSFIRELKKYRVVTTSSRYAIKIEDEKHGGERNLTFESDEARHVFKKRGETQSENSRLDINCDITSKIKCPPRRLYTENVCWVPNTDDSIKTPILILNNLKTESFVDSHNKKRGNKKRANTKKKRKTCLLSKQTKKDSFKMNENVLPKDEIPPKLTIFPVVERNKEGDEEDTEIKIYNKKYEDNLSAGCVIYSSDENEDFEDYVEKKDKSLPSKIIKIDENKCEIKTCEENKIGSQTKKFIKDQSDLKLVTKQTKGTKDFVLHNENTKSIYKENEKDLVPLEKNLCATTPPNFTTSTTSPSSTTIESLSDSLILTSLSYRITFEELFFSNHATSVFLRRILSFETLRKQKIKEGLIPDNPWYSSKNTNKMIKYSQPVTLFCLTGIHVLDTLYVDQPNIHVKRFPQFVNLVFMQLMEISKLPESKKRVQRVRRTQKNYNLIRGKFPFGGMLLDIAYLPTAFWKTLQKKWKSFESDPTKTKFYNFLEFKGDEQLPYLTPQDLPKKLKNSVVTNALSGRVWASSQSSSKIVSSTQTACVSFNKSTPVASSSKKKYKKSHKKNMTSASKKKKRRLV